MTFDSHIFFVFLFATFAGYWLLGRSRTWQNRLLLGCSYVFYGWWNAWYLALIAFTTVLSWWCGKRIAACEGRDGWLRFYNALNIGLNLLILGVFKYYDFFVTSITSAATVVGLSPDWPTLHLLLPIGISFYTFQALSYTIDVRHGRIAPERSLLTYAAYLSFFPQLVAGPIERARDLLPQFRANRSFDYELAADGTRQMLWGFFKKIAVANACAETVGMIFDDYASADSLTLLYGATLFAMQIYADFSGYSDIAIGCAKLFGFRLTRNFAYPYFAFSIPEFWRRWHITLTGWFRDYVYIPLGGSHCGRWRTWLNTMVIFTLSGLWHGADWHFVMWGVWHGLLFTPYCLGFVSKRWHPTRRTTLVVCGMVTMVQVVIGWVIFRCPDVATACHYQGRMLTAGINGLPPYSKHMLLPIALMLAVEFWQRREVHGLQIAAVPPWARRSLYYVLLGIILWYIGASSQFIYFQF